MNDIIRIHAEQAADQFSALRTQLSSILDFFDPASRIFYIDYPVHHNVGDLLINIGTEEFFLENNIPIYRRYNVFDLPRSAKLPTGRNATFIFQGGGNFGDLYRDHQRMREWMIEAFPRVRLIFLPQSIYYSSKQLQDATLKKISRHSNYHIFTRDRESLDSLNSSGILQASMMPDMAQQLWGSLRAVSSPTPAKDMYFFRRDIEATPPPPEFVHAAANHSVDWEDIISFSSRAGAKSVYFFLKAGGRFFPSHRNATLWYAIRDALVGDAIRFFSNYERVYTNRLHAMLLALLLGRDVTAFDNTYGKSSRYINAWLTPAAIYETV